MNGKPAPSAPLRPFAAGHDNSAGVENSQVLFASAVRDLHGSWPAHLLSRVVPGGTLDAGAALDVYRNCYVARLTEQLGETYATVWRVLGDDGFFDECARYIAARPSTSYNLSDYGREFPGHLASSPLAGELPFLAELASFELAFHDLFHQADHRGADACDAAALAAGGNLAQARLEFGPALRLLALERAVYDLFVRRADADAPALGNLQVDRPQWMMLYRKDTEVMALELGAGTFAAIEALVGGQTVDEALSAAVESDDGFGEADASRLFEILVATGVVTRWIG